ncbi:hypothetical protein WAI453_013093 [Rhynchosporium graminicola]
MATTELSRRRILLITIHLESHDIVIPFGKRAIMYPGPAPLSRIFLEEVSGENIKQPEKQKVQQDPSIAESWESERLREPRLIESGQTKDTTRDGKMLVIVSSNDDIRDQMRALVQGYIQEGVSLVELDYQPK